jgi:hypothetical protein
MSATLICNGCGSKLRVPARATKPKLRCPECGEMCPLPAPAAPEIDEDDINWDEIGPDPEPPARPTETGFRAAGTAFPNLELPDGLKSPKPTPKRPPLPKPADVWPPNASQEDDDNPYGVEGGEDAHCPGCQKVVARDAVICVGCGLDLRSGRQVQKVYDPILKHWDSGWTYRTRLTLFLIGQGIALLGSVGAVLGGQLLAFFGSYALFTLMTAFLLGSFDALDLSRTRKGRVVLIKIWRICFFPQPPQTINVFEYEGITTGRDRESDFWEWFICLVLLPLFVLPAILWWWVFIARDRFYVALLRDHGHPSMMLYRGFDEAKMRDISTSVRQATGFRCDGV